MSLEKHFDCGIYMRFVYLSKYEIIILEHYLVIKNELLVGRNQTSFFVKLSALLVVLIKVY